MFKKGLFLLMPSLIIPFFTSSSISKGQIKLSPKIVFENDSYESLSLENDENTEEPQNLSVLIKLDYDEFKETTIESDNVNLIREKLFKEGKSYHSAKNKELAKKLDLSNFDNVYVSEYSPYISVDTTFSNIADNQFDVLNNIADKEFVEAIYINKEIENEPNLINAKNFAGVTKNYFNSKYNDLDGEGVVVGVLETGIADKTHVNLKYSDVEVRDEWYYIETITEHATKMAGIIAGNNSIAPKCKILSVELFGNPVSEIDWLLNRNVNVINMSYGEGNPSGNYNSSSAYMDYIVSTYKVTIVAASGNEPQNVTNPGLGYNVITVGACTSQDIYATSFSGFNVNSGPRKPTIVAPGYEIGIPYFYDKSSGTSLSAAITTGCIALLMQKDELYKINPQRAIAAVAGNAKRPVGNNMGTDLNNYIGAGALNFKNILDFDVQNYLITIDDSTKTKTYKDILLCSKDRVIRVAVSWLAKATGKESETTFSNYDVHIIDTNGNIVASQTTSSDCIEFLTIKAPKDGFYGIKVVQKGNKVVEGEKIAISYTLYNE